jgi:hypothetical protein
MATLKELNSQLAAAQKKHGAKSQAAGRIQYKINQLNKGSKGTTVKSKTGVVKSKTGVVRQTDATKKKRTVTKRKTPSAKQPNNPFKTVVSAAPAPAKIKGSPIKKKIAANSGSKAKKITSNSGSKGNIEPVKLNNITLSSTKANRLSKQQKQKQIQAENNKKIAAHQAKLAKQKAAKKEAKRQNDAIDAMASKSDKAMRERKKTAARLAGQKQNEKNWNATRKLSTDEKVKQRQKDYRNNKTSPY